MYPKSIQNLIETLKYFPGVGEKSAERMAYAVLEMNEDDAKEITPHPGFNFKLDTPM